MSPAPQSEEFAYYDQENQRFIFELENLNLLANTLVFIYGKNGQLISQIVIAHPQSFIPWNGKDYLGNPVPPGDYTFSINIGNRRCFGVVENPGIRKVAKAMAEPGIRIDSEWYQAVQSLDDQFERLRELQTKYRLNLMKVVKQWKEDVEKINKFS